MEFSDEEEEEDGGEENGFEEDEDVRLDVNLSLAELEKKILHGFWLHDDKDRPNLTVALDGTGDYRSIVEAVGHIPNNSDTFFYIYIKAGIYNENVYVGGEKRNIVMSGDGIGKTIIQSSRSNSSGFGIGVSAALNIESQLFLAKDMSILNSAGHEGGQAVALRTTGNHIASLRCSIEGVSGHLVHTPREEPVFLQL
ncbi:hypothetical protein LWI28_022683 [Acer negundo]|uniref:Pectinesterase n=1 Tax=Acer negundo TaxID=4023 RepID=A0AAD5JR53_ACENE|nr:hypothetical protein LWI28_022683 [Acer negundo]